MIRKLAEMLGYKDSEKEVSGQNIRVGNGVRPSAEPTRAVENQVPASSRLSKKKYKKILMEELL